MFNEQVYDGDEFLKNQPAYLPEWAALIIYSEGKFLSEKMYCPSITEYENTGNLELILSKFYQPASVNVFLDELKKSFESESSLLFDLPSTDNQLHNITLLPICSDKCTRIICRAENQQARQQYFDKFINQKYFLQKLYQVFPAPFYITDDKDVVLEYNHAAKQNMGRAREQIKNNDLTNFVQEIELLNKDRLLIQPDELGHTAALERKTTVEEIITGLRVKGQQHIEWYRTFAAYLNLPGYGIVGYDESITSQKEQEEHIITIRNILDAIISSSTDNIVFVDTNDKVALMNEAAFRHFSKLNQRPVLIGENIIEIIPQDRIAIFKETLETLKQQKQVEREHKVIYPDGSETWLYRKFYPVYDEQDHYLGYVIYSGDISAQKEFELRLTWQNEQLKEIARIQTEELIQPLATVLGLVRIIIAKANLDKELLALLKQSAIELDAVIKSKTYLAESLIK